MALTGIQIFKLLPKTNCKECGVPTCLAFAMNLASGKAELELTRGAKTTIALDGVKSPLGGGPPPTLETLSGDIQLKGDIAFVTGAMQSCSTAGTC